MQEPQEILDNVAALDALMTKSDLPVAVPELPANEVVETKPTPDPELYTQSDALLVAVFNTLGVKQKANIIRKALVNPPKDRIKVLAIKEASNRVKQADQLFNIKRIALYSALTVLGIMAVIMAGIFVWLVMRKGTMTDTTVLSGIITTMANVLKIIWSAPTGG